MLKEITETYHFPLDVFNIDGIRRVDGLSFRDLVKQWEWNFHELHPDDYALNLYANSCTMHLLQRSCGAADFLSYGMELTQGTQFSPMEDAKANKQIDKFSEKIMVYGIDSAFMNGKSEDFGMDEDKMIYPLTLLIDDTLRDGVLKLTKPIDDDGDDDENVIVNSPKTEYAYV